MAAMSVPAERVWNPDDLLLTDSIRQVFAGLPEDRAKQFLLELVEALVQAKEGADLTPVNAVITGWYRTMQFLQDPKAMETYERVVREGSHAERLTAAEAVKRVGEMRSALHDRGRGRGIPADS